MTTDSDIEQPVDNPLEKYHNIDLEEFNSNSLNSRTNALAYLRVSSEEQATEGRSLNSQREALKNIFGDLGITLICDPITDEGVSGTIFTRDSLNEIYRKAENPGYDYLAIRAIDRLGRHALKTMNFIWQLREQWGITLLTETYGELDFARHEHQPIIIRRCAEAQRENEKRSEMSQRGVIQSYREGNWTAFDDRAPLGYIQKNDDGWIAVEERETALVKKIFGVFNNADTSRAYTETAEAFPKLAPTQQQIKKIVSNEVYVGWTIGVIIQTCSMKNKIFYEANYEPSLTIIDDAAFDRAQEKIDRISEKQSTNTEETGLDILSSAYAAVPALNTIPVLTILCPRCNSPMNKNGRSDDPEIPSHYYFCPECGKQRLFPRKAEWERLNSEPSGSISF